MTLARFSLRAAERLHPVRTRVAAMMLESHLFDYDDFVWINGDPREPRQPLDPVEPVRDLDEVLAELRETLDLQRAAEAQDKS
ncbi:hypothetical protein HZ989_10315 [Brevundimonas sp. AJA228-03]|uniref:hypothetical protein n=1 Tax=Brevundimonas sp. AJA228-03 TaxID=2752515 RepID=UPI001AE0787B|nr:hypothetical protein [Brevundimonas sp. AJA228-03]QTN18644.1 hypothetical protein HZ989_10315 [Brevundimonas sp. AJA228-03]